MKSKNMVIRSAASMIHGKKRMLWVNSEGQRREVRKDVRKERKRFGGDLEWRNAMGKEALSDYK